MKKISVSIVNVTSYTGVELLRLLWQHPYFQLISVTARSAMGKRLVDIFPHLHGALERSERSPAFDPALLISEEPAQTDLAFVCLPHAAAAQAVAVLLQQGSRVIDLSADFRLRDAHIYEEWYTHIHPIPDLLKTAVYGLCERYRDTIEGASLIANPGCYATASILALLPAISAGMITADVIIDAKSGVSGAGRSPSSGTHYSEVNEDFSAYSLTGHRHLPEIVQELEHAASAGGHPLARSLRLTFLPHLIPMTRGILATCYADIQQDALASATIQEDIVAFYEAFYADEPFVQVVAKPPHTSWTYGTNMCFIYPTLDRRTGRLLVISCLDNLVKGAAGQAIQNANRLYGLPETSGLSNLAVYP